MALHLERLRFIRCVFASILDVTILFEVALFLSTQSLIQGLILLLHTYKLSLELLQLAHKLTTVELLLL